MALSPPTAHEPANFAYAAGDVIAGKYELEELLGEGGMGAVFRARNTAIDMPVAIKLIRADLNRELLSGRLLQEARAAAKLAHPAIVRVFDVGQTESGDPFIVMELLSGENLAQVVGREGRLTGVRAVQLLLPIADALSAAHGKGFVHRDVKPDNVFVVVSDDQLQPKLVDFGIVKLEKRDKDSKLTQAGTLLGSPDYMSPEQARGLDDIDLRSDVWSFSVMLYEAIAGEAPFSSPSYNALLRTIVEDEPPSLLSLEAADAALSAIVERGLNKDRDLRFQSMTELGRALADWLTSQGFAEDACGVSLETKWLSRSSDASRAAGRSSHPGGLGSWSEPPPGVRAVDSHADFGTAPTLQLGTEAGTPISIWPLTVTIPPRARSLYLGAAGAAVATVLALVGWVASGDSDSARVSGAAFAGEAAPEPRDPSPAAPAPSSTPNAVTSAWLISTEPAAPVASVPVVIGKPKALRPLAPQKPAAPSNPPTDAPTPKPASDLLPPY